MTGVQQTNHTTTIGFEANHQPSIDKDTGCGAQILTCTETGLAPTFTQLLTEPLEPALKARKTAASHAANGALNHDTVTLARMVNRKTARGTSLERDAAARFPKRKAQSLSSTRASKRMQASLKRVCKLLQATPRERRREWILSLCPTARSHLLSYMEAQARAKPAQSASQSKPSECKDQSRKSTVGCCSMRRGSKSEAAALEINESLVSNQPAGGQKSPKQRAAAGVAHLQLGKRGLYRAKTTVHGVTIYGTYAPLPLAMVQRTSLQRIRQSVLETFERDAYQDSEVNLADFHELAAEELEGFKAHVTLNAFEWIGTTQVTSPIMTLPEALHVRTELLEARATGWEAFRAMWLQLLNDPRHPPRNHRSASSAEEYIDNVVRQRMRTVDLQKKQRTAKAAATKPPKVQAKSTRPQQLCGSPASKQQRRQDRLEK
eukprot:CAMPEP_0178407438 /NCGR_PEP_ID=MMETSP0689_2-20121128/19430_1 /TAXON_ID=160604 /ORGANISM="Amphidinium massartii, Strain CS-259" /LENGTH=433 /DNA_ID=CAMNT_0020028515 /DNA_START=161 /DNA_END=1459 /DNA_ORIENTATION=-